MPGGTIAGLGLPDGVREATVSVRPEDVHLVPPAGEAMTGRVTFVRDLGATIEIYRRRRRHGDRRGRHRRGRARDVATGRRGRPRHRRPSTAWCWLVRAGTAETALGRDYRAARLPGLHADASSSSCPSASWSRSASSGACRAASTSPTSSSTNYARFLTAFFGSVLGFSLGLAGWSRWSACRSAFPSPIC